MRRLNFFEVKTHMCALSQTAKILLYTGYTAGYACDHRVYHNLPLTGPRPAQTTCKLAGQHSILPGMRITLVNQPLHCKSPAAFKSVRDNACTVPDTSKNHTSRICAC